MNSTLRSVLFALLSFVFVAEAAAQARTEAPPIRFSVAAGFNVSQLNLTFPLLDEIPEEIGGLNRTSRIGLVAGGLVDFRVAPGTSLLTGALFSTRGGTIEASVVGAGSFDIDMPMTYLDVPAFVAVGVAGAGKNRFELLGGAMIGFQADAKFKVSAFGVSVDEEFPGELPAVDFGLSVGGRYTFGHIFGAAYYTWGLTDLTEGDSPDPIKHRYLTVIGGWRF
ncbi:MAG TPA: porin family protein [Vicinamibacterales bacterium]|nr:porin family protein [Vicinamibacterales bacterium]